MDHLRPSTVNLVAALEESDSMDRAGDLSNNSSSVNAVGDSELDSRSGTLSCVRSQDDDTSNESPTFKPESNHQERFSKKRTRSCGDLVYIPSNNKKQQDSLLLVEPDDQYIYHIFYPTTHIMFY
jgi:hypothetical protein